MLRSATVIPCLLLSLVIGGCGAGDEGSPSRAEDRGNAAPAGARPELSADRVLAQFGRADRAAAEIDSVFRPLPLLSPAQEAALRQYPNAAQLQRARELGPGRQLSQAQLEALERAGDLVRLADSEYWVIGRLESSQPLVISPMRDLLEELGRRFHGRLAELGAPPFRFEISSLLRSAADQERLRAVNPNAARGVSTHEYATTVDVLYSAFSAPAEPIVSSDRPESESIVRRYAEVAAERVAARRALELKAVLGEVLLELQREGRVMVTLERQQPVFHMTVAR